MDIAIQIWIQCIFQPFWNKEIRKGTVFKYVHFMSKVEKVTINNLLVLTLIGISEIDFLWAMSEGKFTRPKDFRLS